MKLYIYIYFEYKIKKYFKYIYIFFKLSFDIIFKLYYIIILFSIIYKMF